MTINEKNAYNITERLAFPRLVGTPGEKEAINIVEDEFKKAGYDSVVKEEFITSMYSWNFSRWVFIPIGLYLILIAFSIFLSNWITLVLVGIFMIIGMKALGMVSPEEVKLSRNEKFNFITENLYVNLPSPNSKAKVILMAHHDSKGQSFPKIITIILYIVVIFGFMMMLFIYLILSIVSIFFIIDSQILIILSIISVILAVLGSLNYFNIVDNRSPGAADDGAGVGAVIEMARYFKQNSIENLDIIFLTTGAEELNLGGARDYIARYKDQFDPNSTYFINLDSFGGNSTFRLIKYFGIPKRTGSELLNDLFLQSGKELGIPVKQIYLPTGAWSDFMPMIKKGFQTCWIDAIGKSVKYVHTDKDDMSLVSEEGLKKGINLCVDVIKKLNNQV